MTNSSNVKNKRCLQSIESFSLRKNIVSNYCTYFLLNTTKNFVRGKKLGEKSKVILLNLVDFFNQLPLKILIIKMFSLFNFTRLLNFD